DLETTIRDLALLGVRHLADVVYVSLRDDAQPDSYVSMSARKGTDDGIELDAGLQPEQLATDLASAISGVMSRSTAERLPGNNDKLEPPSRALILPLEARGRIIAVLSLVRSSERGPFSSA